MQEVFGFGWSDKGVEKAELVIKTSIVNSVSIIQIEKLILGFVLTKR